MLHNFGSFYFKCLYLPLNIFKYLQQTCQVKIILHVIQIKSWGHIKQKMPTKIAKQQYPGEHAGDGDGLF